LAHPRSGSDRGQTIPRPLPLQADGLAVLKPFWELPAGKRNTSAPNSERLGHLRCARQELVRLSESNTKYGGKLGTTGAYAAPVMGPSIGESKRIPKLKKSCSRAPATLTPALHRQPPYSPSRACAGATHGCLRKVLGWHAPPRVVQGRLAATFRPDSAGSFSCQSNTQPVRDRESRPQGFCSSRSPRSAGALTGP